MHYDLYASPDGREIRALTPAIAALIYPGWRPLPHGNEPRRRHDDEDGGRVMSEMNWRDAVAYSHNYATAKPDIGRTEKEHILGLCKVLEVCGERLEVAERERDRLRAALSSVVNEMPHRESRHGNAPGHGHSVPGIWDSDNGALAGKPCGWCAVWAEAERIAKEPDHD